MCAKMPVSEVKEGDSLTYIVNHIDGVVYQHLSVTVLVDLLKALLRQLAAGATDGRLIRFWSF